jgi:hypothetical protein
VLRVWGLLLAAYHHILVPMAPLVVACMLLLAAVLNACLLHALWCLQWQLHMYAHDMQHIVLQQGRPVLCVSVRLQGKLAIAASALPRGHDGVTSQMATKRSQVTPKHPPSFGVTKGPK